ncbi:MAG: primosomal protein N' [Burkholderiaceae bacterium]|nr:primosomal protein N' [Burkholderiaceae bacterium]
MDNRIVKVIVDAPLNGALDYLNNPKLNLKKGGRCLVCLGRRTVIGIVVDFSQESEVPSDKLKEVIGVPDDIAPLTKDWLELCQFTAHYYLSYFGNVAIPALPRFFRTSPNTAHERSIKKMRELSNNKKQKEVPIPQLTDEQKYVVEDFGKIQNFGVGLLFGITGSGKTEVYMRLIDQVLSKDLKSQVLLMVPEINLTPQLVKRVQERFPKELVTSWHSAMAEGKKASAWLATHEGRSRIMVGTRLSVFASLPSLKLIIVDEEHESSFKSIENVRYSSRDLAIKRAQLCNIPILLGSATPSFESLKKALDGDYRLYRLTHRAKNLSQLPKWEFIDTSKEKVVDGLSQITCDEITKTIDAKHQVLVFLNRRGYAPVVTCNGCGWHSLCPHCSTFAVYHKTTGRLTCHHCGWSMPIPKSCPKCGSVELVAVGRGTQRIEEEFDSRWPEANILRLDQDTTRTRGSVEKALSRVHEGEVDILLGTQIIAKGHDFQNIALVVILNADGQLLSSDLRARERLFSLLMQVSGRAGRGSIPGKVILQTRYPEDDFFKYLADQDYEGFALKELRERNETCLPPYSAQALIVAEGNSIQDVLVFLKRIKDFFIRFNIPEIQIYDPVPQAIVKIQDISRGQLLVEAKNRKVLQYFLARVIPILRKKKTGFSWYIDVDPISI